MAPTHVLDDYYLAITVLVSLAMQLSAFVISFTFQTDKLTDFSGALNYFVLAILTLCLGGTYYARNIVASVFVMVWSARLGGFLLFRVLKTGKDARFDEMRAHIGKFAAFWTGQLVWVWTVSLPLTILNSPKVSDPSLGGGNAAFGSASDIAGIIMWAIGFTVEAVGDQQKYLFKANKPPKGAINDKGLWYFSRHPNFFGEIFLWWGMYSLCLQPTVADVVSTQGGHAAQYAAVVSPVFITLLLLFASGLPTAEKPTAQKYFLMSHGPNAERGAGKWEEYKDYVKRTSILLPLPPQLYKRLPSFVKTWLLLDLPIYHFDEDKDGKQALESERQKQENEQA